MSNTTHFPRPVIGVTQSAVVQKKHTCHLKTEYKICHLCQEYFCVLNQVAIQELVV